MDDEARALLARIEAKLDVLIAALSDEDEDQIQLTLDGEPLFRDREEGAPL